MKLDTIWVEIIIVMIMLMEMVVMLSIMMMMIMMIAIITMLMTIFGAKNDGDNYKATTIYKDKNNE